MADIFPNISFDESDVGPRPIVPVAGSRIGVVGEFLKGPNKEFILVDTPENLIKILGKDSKNGSVAIQTAMDQGARDFGVRRVLGSSVAASGYLRPVLDSVAGASGKVLLMTTGFIVPVLGVVTKDQIASDIAKAVNAFGFAGMRATNAANNVNLQSSIDNLPISLRLSDRNQPGNSVADSGIKFMLPDGSDITPGGIIRLSGSSLDFNVEYNQADISSELTVSVNNPVAGNGVTLNVGNTAVTASVVTSSVATVTLANVADGETVTVTIGGHSQNYIKASGNTNKDIMDAIAAKFATENPEFLLKQQVTVASNNNGQLLVSAVLNKAFAPLSVVANVLPVSGQSVVGSASVNNNGQVVPALTTAAGLVAELGRQLALARPELSSLVDSAKLTIKPLAPLVSDINLSATVSANVTATLSTPTLKKPIGALKSFDLHIMLGAEADVVLGATTAESLATELSQNLNTRGLATFCTVNAAVNELVLRTKFEGSAGNKVLVSVSQYVGNVPAAIGALSFKYRPGSLNGTLDTVANSQTLRLAGALAGPTRGALTFQRRKFVRNLPVASLSFVSNKVSLAFTRGEVGLNGLVLDLTGTSCEPFVNNDGTNYVVAYRDASGAVQVKTTNVVSNTNNEVVIGEYQRSGNASANNLGVFTSAAPVNGDILRVEASSEGSWSNDLKVSLSQTGSLVTLTSIFGTETDENYSVETLQFDLLRSDTFDGNEPYPLVAQSKSSNYVRVMYVNGTEEGKFAELHSLSNVALNGGDNGPPPTYLDYLRALDAMDSDSVNILIASGNTHPQVRQKLVEKAEASNETNGLRIAVLCADRRLSAGQAANQTANFDSAYAVMVGGWATYANRSDLPAGSTPPDGFYAGHIASMKRIEASPAARTSAPKFVGITSVDIPVTGSQAYNLYTKARLEMIIPDQLTGGFHCLNGRSLSSDPAWNWISLRRIYNYIRTVAFQSLQFAKSEPNSPELRRSVGDTVDQLLYIMKVQKMIDGYQATKVDSENNPPNLVAQGMLRVDMFFTPVYPADFITVGLHRVVPVSLTVQTGQ